MQEAICWMAGPYLCPSLLVLLFILVGICLRNVWTISVVPLFIQNSLYGQVSLHLFFAYTKKQAKEKKSKIKVNYRD